jgi:SAM-dependent methyltransferase
MKTELTIERRITPALPVEVCQRLLAFYERQPDATPQCSQGWRFLHGGSLLPLVDALRSKDVPRLANVLGCLYQNKVMYGLDSSRQYLEEYDLGSGEATHLTPEFYLNGWLGLLRTVACNFGGAGVPNPEQGGPACPEPEVLVDIIEKGLGFRLDFPGAGSVSGVNVAGRYIPHKLLDGAGVIATAMRLKCWPPNNVLEIGAGAAWLGYLCHQLRIPNYSIVDLPAVAVIGASVLATSISPGLVWLQGEPRSLLDVGSFVFGSAEPLKPLWEGSFDLVINQNSFPEIDPPQQEEYVKLLEWALRPGGVFLSINHETDAFNQRRAFIAMSASSSFKLTHRSPWWTRPGWVEEIWEHT